MRGVARWHPVATLPRSQPVASPGGVRGGQHLRTLRIRIPPATATPYAHPSHTHYIEYTHGRELQSLWLQSIYSLLLPTHRTAAILTPNSAAIGPRLMPPPAPHDQSVSHKLVLFLSVAQPPMASIPKGEEPPFLGPRCCVLITFCCTDHVLPCQRFDQPRHRLVLFPSVAQPPIVSIPKGEELPCLSPNCCVSDLLLHRSLSSLPAPRPASEELLLIPSAVAQPPIVSPPKGEELPRLCPCCCVPTLTTCRCTNHLLPCQRLNQPRHQLIFCPSVAQSPKVSIPKGEELSCLGPYCRVFMTCRRQSPASLPAPRSILALAPYLPRRDPAQACPSLPRVHTRLRCHRTHARRHMHYSADS
jgi:hypothetical protein